MSSAESPVLSVRGLTRRFGNGCPSCLGEGPGRETTTNNYCPNCGTVHALRDVNLDVFPGETLGIVGESGSGKTTLMNCLHFDDLPTLGQAFLSSWKEGKENVFSASSQARRAIRNELLGKVYQNPAQGLRMGFSALANVAEKMICAGNRSVDSMEKKARGLLDHVNIPNYRVREAPSAFSGGMQQRVQIAKALSNDPPILFLDEVTTGLDLSVQARVLDLIRGIRSELGISILLVSHDLGVIRLLADRTMVMLDGKIVESGLTDQILEDPQHPYTQELVHSLL